MSRDLLSISEAAWCVHAPEERIRALVQSGDVPSLRFKRDVMIDPDDLPKLAERIGLDQSFIIYPSADTSISAERLARVAAFASALVKAKHELDQRIETEGVERFKPVIEFLESIRLHQDAILAGQEEAFDLTGQQNAQEPQPPEQQPKPHRGRPKKARTPASKTTN